MVDNFVIAVDAETTTHAATMPTATAREMSTTQLNPMETTTDTGKSSISCFIFLVPGVAVTKPPPPVIFCQIGVSHICSGGGDFGKLQ